VRGYLLDTNHLSSGVGIGTSVALRVDAEKRKGQRVGTCIPALCELESGIQQVRDPVGYRESLEVLMDSVRIWPLTLTTARHFGEIHQDLKRRGRALSSVDIMLAALCREVDLTLVTTDKDFAAQPWLKTEDWTI
jgi:predicted nucleic acid-binding protein